MRDFLFVDLSSLTPGRPFAGFAAGSFVDMNGRAVEFTAAQLGTFIANTKKAIAAALGKGMPGLPIDARAHDKGDAAGWIVDATEGEVTDSDGVQVPVIMLAAEWTRLGLELLRDRIVANFSPTVDLRSKVIRGGSLTNWPASVDGNGVPLFPAVELAEGMYRLGAADDAPEQEEDEVLNMTREELAALVAEQVKAALDAQAAAGTQEEAAADEGGDLGAAFAGMPDVSDEVVGSFKAQMQETFELMKAQAVREAAEMVTQMRRDADVADFAAGIVGGTADAPYGLPVDEKDLREFLGRLQPTDLEFAKKLLGDIQAQGRTEFAELGHGKQTRGRVPLPREYAGLLREHVRAGGDIDTWFNYAGIGQPADYDLSNFEEN